MAKRLLPLVAGIVLAASPAQAALFTLDSYHVTLRDVDPGLVLWEKSLLGTPYSFVLDNVGDTHVIELFKVGTYEESSTWFEDTTPYAITVSFTFTNPPPTFGGNAAGVSGAGWLFDYGYVEWDNPLVLDFGSTGQLGIWLTDAKFGLPGYDKVYAKFKLLATDSGAPTPVPEPASAALLGLGAVAVAAFRRRS